MGDVGIERRVELCADGRFGGNGIVLELRFGRHFGHLITDFGDVFAGADGFVRAFEDVFFEGGEVFLHGGGLLVEAHDDVVEPVL